MSVGAGSKIGMAGSTGWTTEAQYIEYVGYSSWLRAPSYMLTVPVVLVFLSFPILV
ncbi:hypothetical protein L211DRAFT_832000 [Terfezia boudieri ATCC MYA-4762]|uniref:Uncharacterized protein n=1 Tax=Terfezia boudieri ATCC MYA-4762 TaxID=1051890 RepID=A0A3N4MAV3_9PEZI|nr:hypothetical protein L211DRAFT_832000 [Terfezia boudieri ATCC MYA-4762]